MTRAFAGMFVAALLAAAPAPQSPKPPHGEWIRLFDVKTTAGWRGYRHEGPPI